MVRGPLAAAHLGAGGQHAAAGRARHRGDAGWASRRRGSWRGPACADGPWWAALAALPLAVPSYVAAFVWVSGPLGLSGLFGAWLVMTLSTVPLVILPTAAAFRRADRSHEEVARGLGLGLWATTLRVTVPQALPAASAGALLAFLYVLFDFGAVSILRYETLTRALYATYRASFDRSATATLALLLVALTVAAVAAEQIARGRARRHRVGSGSPRPAADVGLGRWAPLAYAWLVAARRARRRRPGRVAGQLHGHRSAARARRRLSCSRRPEPPSGCRFSARW